MVYKDKLENHKKSPQGCNSSNLISIVIKEVKTSKGKTCLETLIQALVLANPQYSPLELVPHPLTDHFSKRVVMKRVAAERRENHASWSYHRPQGTKAKQPEALRSTWTSQKTCSWSKNLHPCQPRARSVHKCLVKLKVSVWGSDLQAPSPLSMQTPHFTRWNQVSSDLGRNTRELYVFLTLCCWLPAGDLLWLPDICQEPDEFSFFFFSPCNKVPCRQHCADFTDEEIRAQKGEMTHSGSHI